MKKYMSIDGLVLTKRFHQLKADLSSPAIPQGISHAQILQNNNNVAQLIGLNTKVFESPSFLDVFSGNALLEDSTPIAQAYAGHQFGNFNPFLGDGRSILLGEINSPSGCWDIGLKGAGKTPYTFASDGRASVDECLYEFEVSEHLVALGIPVTRSLCVIQGAEKVYRSGFKSVAMLARVAPSFIRFGNFEYCYFKKDYNALKALTDYVIEHHFPDCLGGFLGNNGKNDYAKFFYEVVKKTATLIAHWQNVGFVHGMMNTDNQSILGLTLDLGESTFIKHRDDDFRLYPINGGWALIALG